MREAGCPNGRGKLTTAQQEHVVARLAAFETPGAIARSLREEFGIEIRRRTLLFYDPTRWRRCPERWKQLFFAVRQAVLRGKGVRRAARRAVRMRTQEHVTLRAFETLAGDVLDHAAAPPDTQPTERERARAILALLQNANVPDSDRKTTRSES